MLLSRIRLKERADLLEKKYKHPTERSKRLQATIVLAYHRKCLCNLSAILARNKYSPRGLIIELEAFFRENWAFVKNSALAYTALANHEVTHFICDVARFVVDEKNKCKKPGDAPDSIVTLLMPSIRTESLNDAYKTLSPYQDPNAHGWRDDTPDIVTLLRTHILSDDGLSLLPVHLLTQLDLNLVNQKIPNPYYDYSVEGMSPYLNPEEWIRLFNHSELTKRLSDAKNHYESIANANHLLGRLRSLCRQLSFHSVFGIGDEEQASAGAYTAIIAFHDYYQGLDDIEKSKIPSDLLSEIENLINLCTDAMRNADANETLETCISIRRATIMPLMSSHEEILSTIGDHQATLTLARKEFETCKHALDQALLSQTYGNGTDTLGFTLEKLQKLRVTISFSSTDDLILMEQLSVKEIATLLKNKKIRRQLIDQLESIETLVDFTKKRSLAKLRAVLSALGPDLPKRCIQSGTQLASWLVTLDNERCEIVCSSLKNTISTLFPQPHHFKHTLQYIGEEQIGFVCHAFKRHITQSSTFLSALFSLCPSHLPVIFETVKSELPALIQSDTDFESIIYTLPPKQTMTVCEIKKAQLRELVLSTKVLAKILMNTPMDERHAMYEKITRKTFAGKIDGLFLTTLMTTQLHITGAMHLFRDTWVTQSSAIKQHSLKLPLMKFELALVTGGRTMLKKLFDNLITLANTHRSRFFTHGNTKSCTQLIKGLSYLSYDHLKMLNNVLGLRLEVPKLDSPEAVQDALKRYINTNTLKSVASEHRMTYGK